MSHPQNVANVTAQDVTLPAGHGLNRLPLILGAVGVVALGASFALGLGGEHEAGFYGSYLTNYMFWLTWALGALFFVLVHHATRAGWGIVVRRMAENYMVTLPVFALLFVPIALGSGHLYHWLHPEPDDVILQGKLGYLNAQFWGIRAIAYFVIWTALALYLYRLSTKQDGNGEARLSHKMRWIAPLGIVLFALTLTFSAIDWVKSLDPHWFSTIFGVYFLAGAGVVIHAVLGLTAMGLQRGGLLQDMISDEHYHGLGKMLFGFTVFWAYIAFSQYFLIWYANIPEETLWYAYRQEGSWQVFGFVLMFGHFVLPFFFFMSRHMKRNRKTFFAAAMWMLLMHWVDMYWLIQPVIAHHEGHHGATFGVLDVTTFLGIGGIFLAVATWRLRAKALVPFSDPRLAESIGFENV